MGQVKEFEEAREDRRRGDDAPGADGIRQHAQQRPERQPDDRPRCEQLADLCRRHATRRQERREERRLGPERAEQREIDDGERWERSRGERAAAQAQRLAAQHALSMRVYVVEPRRMTIQDSNVPPATAARAKKAMR